MLIRLPQTQSLSELSYQLASGELDLTPLIILASRQFQWNEYLVTVRILGASSAISFNSADEQTHEVISCAPTLHSPAGTLETRKDLDDAKMTTVAGALKIECHTLKFSLLEGCRMKLPDRNSLSFVFPGEPGKSLPQTRILWQIESDRLWVETSHTYPNEGVGLHSLTEVSRIQNTLS